ncbi:STAS domain-containing protein [Actinomycetospora atypica]|uniref:STAS domain-containing protein n=1 Tax=Actinomycetospora atypica TaxID=1290095 RepID=A0ABV9YQV8_9PSEU
MTSAWGREQRRRLEATLGVLAEVASAPAREDEPVIAIRSFGPGRLALAVAGTVDGGVVDRLRALLDERLVRQLSARELVIDLSEVRTCGPGLARLLDRVRSRRIAEGCRVELRNPSEAFGTGLEKATLTEAFTVYEAVHRHAPG